MGLDATAIIVVAVTSGSTVFGIVLGIRARRRDVVEEQTAEKAGNVLDSWDDLVGRQNLTIDRLETRVRLLDEALELCQRANLELRGEVIALEWENERYRRGDTNPGGSPS